MLEPQYVEYVCKKCGFVINGEYCVCSMTCEHVFVPPLIRPKGTVTVRTVAVTYTILSEKDLT